MIFGNAIKEGIYFKVVINYILKGWFCWWTKFHAQVGQSKHGWIKKAREKIFCLSQSLKIYIIGLKINPPLWGKKKPSSNLPSRKYNMSQEGTCFLQRAQYDWFTVYLMCYLGYICFIHSFIWSILSSIFAKTAVGRHQWTTIRISNVMVSLQEK